MESSPAGAPLLARQEAHATRVRRRARIVLLRWGDLAVLVLEAALTTVSGLLTDAPGASGPPVD